MALCACTGPSSPVLSRANALAQPPQQIRIGSPDLTLSQGRVLIRGGWGSESAQFGKRDEASRPGPMSLTVSRQGTIYVLDQVNRRVKRYDASGALLGQIAITSEATEDIALADGDSLYALVYEPGDSPGYRLERYDINGRGETSQLQLHRSMDLVTGLFVDRGSEVWIEQRNDRQTRVVKRGGKDLPPDAQRHVVLGRPDQSHPGLRLSALRTGPNQARVLRVVPGETTAAFLTVTTPLPLIAIHSLASDARGGVYLGLLMGQPEPGGSLSSVRKILLAVHGQQHKVVELASHRATDAFRPLAVSPDGAILQLHTTEEGVTVRRWSLREGGAR